MIGCLFVAGLPKELFAKSFVNQKSAQSRSQDIFDDGDFLDRDHLPLDEEL
jgi:hypothetical protein